MLVSTTLDVGTRAVVVVPGTIPRTIAIVTAWSPYGFCLHAYVQQFLLTAYELWLINIQPGVCTMRDA